MAEDLSIALLDLLRKADPEQRLTFFREAVERLAQSIIEAEVSQVVGAAPYERTSDRTNIRNGSRPRQLDTPAGTLYLEVPKLRRGSFLPSLFEPRRRADRALVNVVAQAYVQGVSTRKVDDLVRALGIEGMDKSMVSRLAQSLDQDVAAFRSRPLTEPFPYVWLDATFPKVREGGRVVTMALMIAIGVNDQGQRSILGVDLGATENGFGWAEFLKSLVDRGLHGVRLVISDDHQGLKKAAREVLTGTSWQRCTVHFTRNVVGQVPKQLQSAVSALVRQIFAQPTRDEARQHLADAADRLAKRFPRASEMLLEAEEDILSHMAFPTVHWRQIRSTNGLERLNREIARRFDVVGIFPNRDSVLRLGGAVLAEQDDEWLTSRRYFSEQSMAAIDQPPTAPAIPDPVLEEVVPLAQPA